KLAGEDRTEENKQKEAGEDLGLDDRHRRIFWDVSRVGFMHQAMGKTGKTKWLVDESIGELPEFRDIRGHSYVCLNPWKFAKRLFVKYMDNPLLIDVSERNGTRITLMPPPASVCAPGNAVPSSSVALWDGVCWHAVPRGRSGHRRGAGRSPAASP